MSNTIITIQIESSQPLTQQQLNFLQQSIINSTNNLPSSDQNSFLDIPEYITDPIITQQ